jgi:hypothetical protein
MRARQSFAGYSTLQKDIACVPAKFGFSALFLESKRIFDKESFAETHVRHA